MTRISGKDGEFRITPAGENTTPIVVGGVQNWSADVSEAQSPAGAMGDDWEGVVGGLKSGTFSGGLIYDIGSAGQEALGVGEEFDVQLDTKKDEVGALRITGRIRISKMGIETPYNDSVKRSVEAAFQQYNEETIS